MGIITHKGGCSLYLFCFQFSEITTLLINMRLLTRNRNLISELIVRGRIEKSVKTQRDGNTSANGSYFQLVASFGGTHTKFQLNPSITLFLAFF